MKAACRRNLVWKHMVPTHSVLLHVYRFSILPIEASSSMCGPLAIRNIRSLETVARTK